MKQSELVMVGIGGLVLYYLLTNKGAATVQNQIAANTLAAQGQVAQVNTVASIAGNLGQDISTIVQAWD